MNDYTYEITTGANFAYAGYGENSIIEVNIRFAEALDQNLLKQAAREMLMAFPFIAVEKRLSQEKDRYILCTNHKEFPVLERSVPLMPYEKETNDYLFSISFNKNVLFFNISHLLTDGFGARSMVHYLGTRYLSLKYDTHPEPIERYNPKFNYDYADPRTYLRPVEGSFKFNYSSLPLFSEDLIDEHQDRRYWLSIDTSAVKKLTTESEGSINGFMAFVLGMALRKLYPESEEVVISSPMDMRRTLGCEQTFRNCNTGVKYKFIKKISKLSVERILTALKGMLYWQIDPDYSIAKYTRECSLTETLRRYQTVEEKQNYLNSVLILSPHPIVTDVGGYDFGTWNDKVKDVQIYAQIIGIAGIMMTYNLFDGKYTLCFTSKVKNDNWFTALCELLKELGIDYVKGAPNDY